MDVSLRRAKSLFLGLVCRVWFSPFVPFAGSGQSSMVLRLQGLALFLFIPTVLVLFLVEPVHAPGALVLGVALMVVHRFLAKKHLDQNIDKRCLWCGDEIAPGCKYRVVSSGVERSFNFYIDPMRDQGAKFLTFAQ
jgi:hypothetical protein